MFPHALISCVLLLLAMGGPDRDVARARNEEGVRLYEAKEYARAIRQFEEALELDPSLKETRTNLGKAHAALGVMILEDGFAHGGTGDLYRKALEQLRLSALYWQGDAHTLHITGFCHLRLGEPALAVRVLERAVEIEPAEFGTWRLYAHALECISDLERAETAYERALAIRPDDGGVKLRLRRIRWDRQAGKEFRKVQSARFEILFPEQISESAALELREILDSFSSRMEKRWNIDNTALTTVICYPPGEFVERTGLQAEVGGAFDGKIRIPFPAEMQGGGLSVEQVLRHEVVHMLLRRAGETPPRWVDEGLAQLLDGDPRADWNTPWEELIRQQPRHSLLDRWSQYREEDSLTWGPLYLHAFFFFKHVQSIGGDFRLDLFVREAVTTHDWDASFRAVYGKSPLDADLEWRVALIATAERGGSATPQAKQRPESPDARKPVK